MLYWIIVGLIAGWLTGKIIRGAGYGVIVASFSGLSVVFWAAGSCKRSGSPVQEGCSIVFS
jgi:uncharacterized membrane protein YeaQ/YmgE (transglycosylase-associated protein family)